MAMCVLIQFRSAQTIPSVLFAKNGESVVRVVSRQINPGLQANTFVQENVFGSWNRALESSSSDWLTDMGGWVMSELPSVVKTARDYSVSLVLGTEHLNLLQTDRLTWEVEWVVSLSDHSQSILLWTLTVANKRYFQHNTSLIHVHEYLFPL